MADLGRHRRPGRRRSSWRRWTATRPATRAWPRCCPRSRPRSRAASASSASARRAPVPARRAVAGPGAPDLAPRHPRRGHLHGPGQHAPQAASRPPGHAGSPAPPAAVFGEDALLPLALLSDCAVYPAAGPSPLDFLPYDAGRQAAPGTFRLGVSPGHGQARGHPASCLGRRADGAAAQPRPAHQGRRRRRTTGSRPVGEHRGRLDRAAANTVDPPHPESPRGAQMRFLLKAEKGSTRAVAARLGVSQRTVERYLKGTLRRPRKDLAARLEREVRQDWQPRVRQRAKKRRRHRAPASSIETRARFGFTAAPGSTDDGRMRRITQHLPPAYAARLFDAQAAGATEQQLQAIAAEGLQEIYFKDRGRRAARPGGGVHRHRLRRHLLRLRRRARSGGRAVGVAAGADLGGQVCQVLLRRAVHARPEADPGCRRRGRSVREGTGRRAGTAR